MEQVFIKQIIQLCYYCNLKYLILLINADQIE